MLTNKILDGSYYKYKYKEYKTKGKVKEMPDNELGKSEKFETPLEEIKKVEQGIEEKHAELQAENGLYEDSRSNRRKSIGEWNAQDMMEIRRKELRKEISELEEELSKRREVL